jgi:hypothetical protein
MPEHYQAPDDEKAFVSHLEELIRVPEDLRCEYERWAAMRDYVTHVDKSRDTPDTVTTNFILRTQYAVIANVVPNDPSPKITPDEWVPIADQVPDMQKPQAIPQLQEGMFNDYPHEWLVYTKSQEIAIKKQAALGGLDAVAIGMVQDTLTLPISWMKMRWVEDYDLDPIGMRHDDSVALTASRYDALRRAWDEDEFTEQDARHYEMQELNRILKDRMSEELAVDLAERPPEPETDVLGNPIGEDPRLEEMRELQSDTLLDPGLYDPPPHYQGYAFEAIDPEDMRFDWSITRPEDMRFAKWMAQRIFLDPAEIVQKWGLTEQEQNELRRNATLFRQDGTMCAEGTAEGKAGEDERDRYNNLESANRGRFMAVWEHWDRHSGMVYRWVQGSGRFLDKFQPTGTPRRFFPFFPLVFNRTTGSLLAPSDSELLKPLQEEMNMLRTHDREARRSSYPRYMVTKGLLSKRAKAQMRQAVPYSVIEVEKASEIAANIHDLIPAPYDPRVYDGGRARQDYEVIAGLSSASLGATGGAELATEAAISHQQLGVQSDRRQKQVLDLYRSVYEAMAQINAQRLSEENAKALAGPGATMLSGAVDRASVLNNFAIEIESVPSDDAEKQRQLKLWLDATTVIGNLALPLNRIEIAKELARLMGFRTNLSRLIDLNMLLAPPPAPAPGGSQAGAPAGRPDQQGDRGGEGGRPPQDESPGAPEPESVPNRPQV